MYSLQRNVAIREEIRSGKAWKLKKMEQSLPAPSYILLTSNCLAADMAL